MAISVRMQRMSISGHGIGWYNYCGGNPIGMVDPTGLDAEGNSFDFSLGDWGDTFSSLMSGLDDLFTGGSDEADRQTDLYTATSEDTAARIAQELGWGTDFRGMLQDAGKYNDDENLLDLLTDDNNWNRNNSLNRTNLDGLKFHEKEPEDDKPTKEKSGESLLDKMKDLYNDIVGLFKGNKKSPTDTEENKNPYRDITINHQNDGGGFGWRINPITGQREFHTGNDYSGAGGKTFAGISGTVRLSQMGANGEGNFVQVKGTINDQTFYANSMHNLQNLVNPGQTVNKNSVVGQPGSTGNSTGVHIHHEVFTYSTNTDFVHQLQSAGVESHMSGSRVFFESNGFYQYLDTHGISY